MLKNKIKPSIIFLLLTFFSLVCISQSNICNSSFLSKTISLSLLIPPCVIMACLKKDFQKSEKYSVTLHLIALLSVFGLALVRNLYWFAGDFPLPGIIYVHNKAQTVGYLFMNLNLSPIVTALAIAAVINSCRKPLSKTDILVLFAEFINLMAINVKYAWIFATTSLVVYCATSAMPFKLNKLNTIILSIPVVLSSVFLLSGFDYSTYLIDGMPPLEAASIILIPMVSAIVSLVCAYRSRKIKYLTVGVFITLSVFAMFNACYMFNSFILSAFVLLVLIKERDGNQHLAEYVKWMITESEPSIRNQIFDVMPKSTVSSSSLAELITASLIGSNQKYRIVQSILNETDLTEDGDNCFDLLILKALLSQHLGNNKENLYFSKAKKCVRRNTEQYILNYFSNPDDIDLLKDTEEDLYGEEKEDCKKRIEEFEAVKAKFEKLNK